MSRQYKPKGQFADVLTSVGIGSLSLVALIAITVLAIVIGVAFTGFFVWLAWNVLGVNAVLGLPELGFWQVVGISILINILFGILRGGK